MAWSPGRPAPRNSGTNIPVVASIGDRLGCKAFNALYGNRVDGASAAEQDELGAENLALAAEGVAGIGGTVLVEPVSGSPRYPLLTAADVAAVIGRVTADGGPGNIGLLADLYHLAVNGDDVDKVIADYTGTPGGIAHVQIADAPGRGAPGTGELPLDRQLADLRDPPDTAAGLAWSTRHHRQTPTPQPVSIGCRGPVGRPTPQPPADPVHQSRTHPPSTQEPRMTSIAFIGLGIMGSPMAVHLAKAGHDVVGYNRSPEKTKPLVEAGGRAADSVAEAVSGAEVVAVMVPDSPDVRDVLAGDGGVFANGKPGALIIDFSSIRPDVTVELAEQAVAQGLPADRCAGVRWRGRRDQRRALDHGRRHGGGFRRGRADPATSSARPSCMSDPTGPGRPSRRPTS